MDREERRFLRKAIKVQQSKDYGFELDGGMIKTAVNIESDAGDPADVKTINVVLSYLSQEYLEENGYIARQNVFAPLYYVTDKGWNYFSDKWEQFFQAIVRDIAVPIIVSVLTTLIILWINGSLNL